MDRIEIPTDKVLRMRRIDVLSLGGSWSLVALGDLVNPVNCVLLWLCSGSAVSVIFAAACF